MRTQAGRLSLLLRSFTLLAIWPALLWTAPPSGGGAARSGPAGPAVRSSGPILSSPGAHLTPPTVGRSFGAIGSPINATGYWSASGFHGITPPGLVNGTRGFFPVTNGGRRGPGRFYNNRLAWTPFLAPYYYGAFDNGNPYDYSSPDYGPEPGDASGSSQDAQVLGNMIGQQLNDLSAQVSDLRQQQQLQQGTPDTSRAFPGEYGNPPAAAAQPDADPPSPPVTLVLRNGQQLQVQNYAIVDGMFWDLSKGVGRKIPLTTIDVRASVKATEDKGGEFPSIPDSE